MKTKRTTRSSKPAKVGSRAERSAPAPRLASAAPTTDLPSLRRLAERLRDDVVRVLNAIPEEHRGVTRMSEWCRVPKPLCFRVLAAARPQSEPLNVVELLPGVEGLARTLNSIAAKAPARSVRTSAAHAQSTYAELIQGLGGTQARARRAVASLVQVGSQETRDGPTRKAAFDSSRAITGVWSDALVIVQCARHSSTKPGWLEGTIATGHVGLCAGHGHLPVTFMWPAREQVPRGLRSLDADRQEGLNHYALLPEFSSDPFPRVITLGENGHERDVIDWDSEPVGARGPVDVFLGVRVHEPMPKVHFESHTIARVPTKKLILDILLPNEFHVTGKPSGEAYFVGFGGPARGDPSSRWHDRLHDLTPAFDSLNTPNDPPAAGVGPSESTFPRHDELIEYVLANTQLHRRNCRHLRWVVPYPLWGCDYAVRAGFGQMPQVG
ncbi:MAG: hypothetical protein IBJ18_12425 [Phycisphaerales bacterium]|nr:hypothetical protein [Phycisphaerales bacterium]